MAPFAPVSNEF